MQYKIQYSYQTGDSFNTSDEEGELELQWENLDVAKENLRRIKEHYAYYDIKNRRSYRWAITEEEKKSLQAIIDEAANKPWYVKEYDFCLRLKIDDEKEMQISAPWCGHFNSLYGAKIIPYESDMSFEI